MALSYFTESEAPRDFRISSTESEGHYTKCLLCYTVKKNFFCPDCIRAGNFVHSSMPYADRFSEKQGKLLRLKANRKHILDRCEKLMAGKLKKDSLITEAKQSRDKLDLLRLAIEQRRNGLDEKRKQLTELTQLNNELRLKLPRYQKRVSHLAAHAAAQRLELHTRHGACADNTAALAALRRERVRQLHKYIFPVYISLDTSDSIEDMEFLGGEPEEEPPTRTQLHIVSPWLCADGDHSHVITWAKQNKEASLTAEPADNPLHRTVAALGLAAQLVALSAWTLDARLPHSLTLSEYSNWRVTSAGLQARIFRLCACAAALCVRAGVAPPPPPQLSALHALAAAAAADDPGLGRVEAWTSEHLVIDSAAWEALELPDEPDPPEHLHWPDQEEPEVCGRSPPAPPAASLVTSAAASLASVWRGWTNYYVVIKLVSPSMPAPAPLPVEQRGVQVLHALQHLVRGDRRPRPRPTVLRAAGRHLPRRPTVHAGPSDVRVAGGLEAVA
ncbi:beclin 1-associated autophagy-related key regulator [Cydia amplana]|uniref:beclin 1-associated autophagy-related key regulator n=1 Tax=Cydia amplana TaxID=1869771 RepID=UPI002FE676AA